MRCKSVGIQCKYPLLFFVIGALFASGTFLYVREIGRRAAIVSTLREVMEEIWQYHNLTGAFPKSNSPTNDWKMVMLRNNHPNEDVTKSIDRYSCIHGVFNEAGAWLVEETSSGMPDPVLVVLVTKDTNGKFGGDWVVSKKNGMVLQIANAVYQNENLTGNVYVGRRGSGIESLSVKDVSIEFWGGVATGRTSISSEKR